MKYFLIAGERSGDLHGGNLVKAIKNDDPDARLMGYGGDYMEKSGMLLLKHYRDISFMGFLEVVQNIGVIRKAIKECKKQIEFESPDVLILIDYPGFNLRMARYAKSIGIRPAYCISPKIWAWKKGRIKKIRAFVDKMFVIFPFEVPFYLGLDYPVTYVGNPLVEYIENYPFDKLDIDTVQYENIIAFLPGSRNQEVKNSIDQIVQLASKRKKDLFLVGAVDNVEESLYEPLQSIPNVRVRYNQTYEILKLADASITTSGTATLETALIGTPQMVCYKTSQISYYIAKAVVTIKFISLVNLIADKEVVKEFIQSDYSIDNINQELDRILEDTLYRSKILKDYQEIRDLLTSESASQNTSRNLQEWLRGA
jgi:lipid-A-disaccharide synthase